MPDIVVGGRRIETARWGNGATTIVLLHEGLGSVALWRDFPERLAAETGCAVFAYSRFGYGRSDPVSLPRSMSYMHDEAQDVLPLVLDVAEIGRAILLGHSDGGSIAAIHAGGVRDPRVIGLITIAAHFFVEDQNIAAIEQIRGEYESGLRPRLARYHDHVDVAFHGWNGAWLDPRFRDFDITGFLPDIAVPVLAIQGADDPYGTQAQLDVLPGHMRRLMIPGARHAPHLEAKDPTMEAIGDFIRTLPGV